VVVPTGMTDVVYEPRYSLNATKTDYVSELAPNTPKTTLPEGRQPPTESASSTDQNRRRCARSRRLRGSRGRRSRRVSRTVDDARCEARALKAAWRGFGSLAQRRSILPTSLRQVPSVGAQRAGSGTQPFSPPRCDKSRLSPTGRSQGSDLSFVPVSAFPRPICTPFG